MNSMFNNIYIIISLTLLTGLQVVNAETVTRDGTITEVSASNLTGFNGTPNFVVTYKITLDNSTSTAGCNNIGGGNADDRLSLIASAASSAIATGAHVRSTCDIYGQPGSIQLN